MKKLAAPSAENDFHANHVRLLLKSHYRLLGRRLFGIDASDPDVGMAVFNGNFALMSHNADPDPLFNYANWTALYLFEYEWDELIGLPSRTSAEPANWEAREKLLAEVSAKGYIEHYSGIRIAKSGKRFNVENAVVWNVLDDKGEYCGQAACFRGWEILK